MYPGYVDAVCEKRRTPQAASPPSPGAVRQSTLRDQFPDDPILRLREVDCFPRLSGSVGVVPAKQQDLALLMLTSGSTGHAKAVCLTHSRILAALAGKSLCLPVENRFALLNWIGLDHVASLVEIHLQAMFIGAEQIHLQPSDVIADPSLFLEMIHRHRVGKTSAPNFFLEKLRRWMESQTAPRDFDLSCLHYIASGGEANVVETCDAVSRLLVRHGAPRNVIVPGFGMTETCAGCIHNRSCPEYDLDRQREFASVGQCVPGIEMRVSSFSGDGTLAQPDEPGNLEVRGPIVFARYYHNEAATSEAFTSDGWFKTGDIAVIDPAGNLSLTGRTKEVISINGVKYRPHELESAIEDANIDGVTPSYTVCLSRWPPGAQTEQLCVIYLPTYPPDNVEARVKALGAITWTMLLLTGARPYVLPLDRDLLPKSTLGKLSRSQIQKALDKGEYQSHEEANTKMIRAFQKAKRTQTGWSRCFWRSFKPCLTMSQKRNWASTRPCSRWASRPSSSSS
ncbi:hypothetical protein VTN96DRAFT_5317 [Rasamsonia emersonii]